MAERRKHQSRKEDEHWLQSHWRPMMAWQYFIVCLFDFLIAPIFFAWFSYITKSTMIQWQPLTIQGGGLYHLSMGAIVGISSYARTQEKVSNNNLQFQNFQQPIGFNQFNQPGFNQQSNQFGQTVTETDFSAGPMQKPVRPPASPKPPFNGPAHPINPLPGADPEI